MDKRKAIVRAVKSLKEGQFKATALKVELEAQLNRRTSSGCGDEDCEDGRLECSYCDGDWEGSRCQDGCDEGYVSCNDCTEGFVECERCDGDGHIMLESGRRSRLNCRDCGGNGQVTCPEDCDGGLMTCEECGGSNEGYYQDCDMCDEGSVECENDHSESDHEWGRTWYCHEWIMEKLSHLGLARYDENENFQLRHDGNYTHWIPDGALKYAEFYNDGSVDSEFTFTLSLENPETVFLLPEIIGVFNQFAEAVNGIFNTSGAGMHMALLNSNDCTYPSTDRAGSQVRFENFQKSMTLLMPALYFLGSGNETSRGLNYRRPAVGWDTHRTAIDFRNGAVEFRVFDTCYTNPDAILDNIVVMSNAMKYWSNPYRGHGLAKIVPQCTFGVDGSDKLERFYITCEHLDLLNKGLVLLKPSYYTITELKAQRKFNRTKHHAKNRLKKVRLEAEIEYKEYENRFAWDLEFRRQYELANRLEMHVRAKKVPLEQRDEVMALLQREVDREIEERQKEKEPVTVYVEKRVKEATNERVGQYTLAEV